MNELLKSLWDNYYEPPAELEKKQAIEDFHMKLVETLSVEDRKLVLHIIDLKDQIAEDLSIDSFMSGFQLAWKLATELNIREKQRPSLPSIPSVRMDAFYVSKFMKEDYHEQKEHHHNGSRYAGRRTDCWPDSQCGSGVPEGTAE